MKLHDFEKFENRSKEVMYPRLMKNIDDYIVLMLDDTGDCVIINPPMLGSSSLNCGQRYKVQHGNFHDYTGKITISN